MPRALVIGAGHNGLVCAAYLARAGMDVIVLEQAPRPGGCVSTEEPIPGYRMNIGAIELGGIVGNGIARELELEREGLRLAEQPEIALIHTPDAALAFHRSLDATAKHLAEACSSAAADEWVRFERFAAAVFELLGLVEDIPPPPVAELAKMAGDAYGGRGDRLFEAILSPADTVIASRLGDPDLRAASAAFGAHAEIPPWLPGSGAFACLLPGGHRGVGARPVGGSGGLIDAVIASIARAGGSVRCDAPVTALRLDGDRVTGGVLESGEEIAADVVVSSIDVRRLADLLPASATAGPIHAAAARAHVGLLNVGELKVDLALQAPPTFAREAPGDPGALRLLVPDHDVGASFRALVAGQLPDPLPVMFAVPSASDPSLAPPGKAVAWVSAFVPARPADGRQWPDGNAAAAEGALATVERFAPGFRSLVIDAVVTGPAEWEARTGNPHGNPNHLDLTVDQLFGSRPAAGLARYRTPIRGLFLSGAGTHPGGGVTGQPGRNTAMTVLGLLRGGKRRSRLADLRLVPAAASYLRMRRAL